MNPPPFPSPLQSTAPSRVGNYVRVGDASASVRSALPKVSMVLSAYHGMRRNRGSILWGLAWGAAGRVFPLLVPALAFAQGFAKEKTCP